jgi:hypothetical protein
MKNSIRDGQFNFYAAIVIMIVGLVMIVSNSPNNAGLVFLIIGFTFLVLSFPGKK